MYCRLNSSASKSSADSFVVTVVEVEVPGCVVVVVVVVVVEFFEAVGTLYTSTVFFFF